MMFELHQRLAADTTLVTDWPLCRVLLMNDATYPWLILVPRLPGVAEIHDLSPQEQTALMAETAACSRLLKAHACADKINIAALGNVVPQLHMHVVARFAADPAWPRPIWGAAPPQPYEAETLTATIAALRALLDGGPV